MEKGDARQFQSTSYETFRNWNIVELESHRLLRKKINDIIELCDTPTITTSEVRAMLHEAATRFGTRFINRLAHLLQHPDQERRATITWLFTVLDDQRAIPPLQALAYNEQLSRSIRISAALALAGMGETAEVQRKRSQQHQYATNRL